MWTSPTVSDFKTRFPAFASVPDATVQAVLDEAEISVGETWIEKFRTSGVLYLTAHLLASQGMGTGAGGGGVAVTGAIKRRTVGDVTTEFVGAAGSTGASDYAYLRSTIYGSQYLRLLRACFPAIAVV